MNDARYATLTGALGLTANDLAEIGGFSKRFARDLVAGRRPFPQDVKSALLEIQADIDALAETIEADVDADFGVIYMFGTTGELRQKLPGIPGRGKAMGGFIGPFRIAAITAFDALRDCGIEVDIVFFD